MENEIWKDIEGYEGLYQVSNLGRVKSIGYGKERILKPRKNNCGYLNIGLCKEGKEKRYYVHRLVAQAFIENPSNYNEVNHKDENKANNLVENLEWCSRKYNVKYGTMTERSALNRINYPTISKKVLCVETGAVYSSTQQAQRGTGIYRSNISSCCLGKSKTAGGYHWKFVKDED